MKAQEARALSIKSLNDKTVVYELQVEDALKLVYSKISLAAAKGKRSVTITYNKSPQDNFPTDWIGPLRVVHWDGGNESSVNDNGQEVIKRLQDDGYQVTMSVINLQVSW